MDNADLPAMPTSDICHANGQIEYGQPGLTKREYFCLHMGVPETGDPVLDAIIEKSNHRKIAAMALQALLSGAPLHAPIHFGQMAIGSIEAADALLSALKERS